MAEMTSSPAALDNRESVAEQTRAQREAYIKAPNGDLVGNNYVVPKGDFAQVLGYKPPTAEEKAGKVPLSGSRVIELALQKEFSELGPLAAQKGNQYRNQAISWGRFNNEPGREKDMIKDAVDAMRQGMEKGSMESKVRHMSPATAPYLAQLSDLHKQSHNDNMNYLIMQYKFQEMSKQDGTISNLMKTRHDCVSRTIRGAQG